MLKAFAGGCALVNIAAAAQTFLAACNISDPYQRWAGDTLQHGDGESSTISNLGCGGGCVTTITDLTSSIMVVPCGKEVSTFLYNRSNLTISVVKAAPGTPPEKGVGACWDIYGGVGPRTDLWSCHPLSNPDYKHQQFRFSVPFTGALTTPQNPGQCLTAATAKRIEVQLTTTGDWSEMVVSWQEDFDVSAGRLSHVAFGLAAHALNWTATAIPTTMTTDTENMSSWSYCGGGFVTRTLHMVVLKNLPPDSLIYYSAAVVNSTARRSSSHVAPLQSLIPSCPVRSDVAVFRTPPSAPAATLRFLATADMGDPISHPWTAIPQMIQECAAARNSSSGAAQEQEIGLGLHVGDIAYNLDIPPRGDDYVRGVSPMGRRFPWMMASGNHESDCNYTYANYLGRFAAQNLTGSPVGPRSGSSRWYSFEQGPVHFVVFDTDAYGFDEVAYALRPQYEWMQADLAAVDRERTPFVVMASHRPMYCSSITGVGKSHLGWPKQRDDIDDFLSGSGSDFNSSFNRSSNPASAFDAHRGLHGLADGRPRPRHVRGYTEPPGYGDGFRALGLHPPPWHRHEARDGAGFEACGIADLVRNGVQTAAGGRAYAVEPLMQQHGVDLYLTGHEHNYERLWPVLNGSITKSYAGPGKPVHVVTGAGGAYSHDTFGPAGPWDAFRSNEWSYSDVLVNRTHLWFRQRYASNGTVQDEFMLTRK
jgi:hypothetical protein